MAGPDLHSYVKFKISRSIPWLIIMFYHFPSFSYENGTSIDAIDGESSATPRPEFCRGERLGTGGLERTFSRRTAPGSPSRAADAAKTIPGLGHAGCWEDWEDGETLLGSENILKTQHPDMVDADGHYLSQVCRVDAVSWTEAVECIKFLAGSAKGLQLPCAQAFALMLQTTLLGRIRSA